ncbi:28S ribosomal protein S23, mitochondrial-like [Xenopus laevis]|uniref:Small ribosomal subunit protein mS23 n=1 Tax=Xenopus laevis TaxID=8355 RepID=A0A8J0UI92_XENLA|nr:28S ribosomal protein S23, mitochondrial-like [Xenopus laevis]
MAGSRLEKLGTVFSRVRDLLRAGIIKQNEKPVWYDVYAAFPPKRDPLYEKPLRRKRITSDNVPSILYKEDIIRATFFEAYGNGPRAFELSRTNFKSTCQRFVEKYAELQKNGEMDENKLFEETGKALLAEGIILRRKGTPGVRPQHPQVSETQDPLLEMNLKKMLEEMQQQQEEKTQETKNNPTP